MGFQQSDHIQCCWCPLSIPSIPNLHHFLLLGWDDHNSALVWTLFVRSQTMLPQTCKGGATSGTILVDGASVVPFLEMGASSEFRLVYLCNVHQHTASIAFPAFSQLPHSPPPYSSESKSPLAISLAMERVISSKGIAPTNSTPSSLIICPLVQSGGRMPAQNSL